MKLVQHEMQRLPALPLSLRYPAQGLLAARCRQFVQQPSIRETINDWCEAVGMSRRTFTRTFRQETGLSFVAWRQQACLLCAMPRLAAGEPVTTVAIDLGYENPAAFSLMFKRAFGSLHWLISECVVASKPENNGQAGEVQGRCFILGRYQWIFTRG